MFPHIPPPLVPPFPSPRTSSREDDVSAVASLLGDVLAYRAVGASHLELLAGLAILQATGGEDPPFPRSSPPLPPPTPAPLISLKEASTLLPFAMAAYTVTILPPFYPQITP